MTRRSFEIRGDCEGNGCSSYPLRASFHDYEVLPVSLPASPTGRPDIVLGADILRGFSVQIDFGTPALTLWSGQRAPDAFLGAAQCAGSTASPACFAVLHGNLLGGGELTAISEPDFLGLTGPVEFGATRLLLRACAAPAPADPLVNLGQPTCCTRSAAVTRSSSSPEALVGYAPTGADLSLVVTTGLGPTVLSASAWQSVADAWSRLPGQTPLPEPSADDTTPLYFPALPDPIAGVKWSDLPRIALVDLESDPSTNPGACVELARARRLEWVERRRAEAAAGLVSVEGLPQQPACTQLCDTDLREPAKAQNAAGYLERAGTLRVAIIPDGASVLQTVRAELRQQGPQVDGFLGANLLAPTTMEIDYGATPARVVFSCLAGADRSSCLASPRCVRQASVGDLHSCFGLPPLPLPDPKTCLPLECS